MQEKIKMGNLVGVLHKPNVKSSHGVVMVHGFGGEGLALEFTDVAKSLSKKGFAVLRFLFSGYETGDLTKLTVSNEIRELKSAIDFLEMRGVTKIALVAQSLGCAVSILLNDPRVNAMALLAPGTNLRAWPLREFGTHKIQELEKFGKIAVTTRSSGKVNIGVGFWTEIKNISAIPMAQIKKIKCPLLIIYGTNDKTFELKEYEQLFRLANEPKELIVIKGVGHVTIKEGKFRKEIIQLITEFFSKFLNA